MNQRSQSEGVAWHRRCHSKGIGDVPPTSERQLFVQKSTARDFAKPRPNTIEDGAARSGKIDEKSMKKGLGVRIMGQYF